MPISFHGPIILSMHLSGFLGTGATIAQLRRKLHLQKALKAARLDRAISLPDLANHIPIGYVNAILALDQDGQIEILVIAIDFTLLNADWTMFAEYLASNAPPGLMMKICQIAFAANAKQPVVQFDVRPDIDGV